MSHADPAPAADASIIVVSGLPRSGTSLIMQMLAAGGVPLVTDGQRSADEDNPRGYFEDERVKRLQQGAEWLAEARGRAVKIISQLLFSLPPGETYRIILMRRNLDEILASQAAMLERSGRAGADPQAIRKAFAAHLTRLEAWLPQQPHLTALSLEYAATIGDPQAAAARIAEFLQRPLDVTAMAAAVDPALYRNRGVGDSP